MGSAIFYGLAAAMAGYWTLWVAGVHMPGTSSKTFRGWIYSENEKQPQPQVVQPQKATHSGEIRRVDPQDRHE